MGKWWHKGEVRERDRARTREGWRFAAKRDAVIRRYWQFSRSITGTRKEKILRLKFIEGVERAEQGGGGEMTRDAGDREKQGREGQGERERGREMERRTERKEKENGFSRAKPFVVINTARQYTILLPRRYNVTEAETFELLQDHSFLPPSLPLFSCVFFPFSLFLSFFF